ncbi:UDP-N-acetylglucosamine--LPS N-acetylglucosamine transferase [Tsuneonella aeria]|uniref:UDP-N-acetylglucosamine--LPS N-acetylglucosamine transferase n=1 Tax=Tsuneonella aeria TaxID=1837929 RepID=UPI001927CE77
MLAIASGGGHWDELLQLRGAFQDTTVHYATTLPGLADRAGIRAHVIPDCNRKQPLRALRCAFALTALLVIVQPTVVVTTGALPGLLAIAIARKMGVRTVWIDSVANADEMSLAGQKARRHADLWLTQWPAIAQQTGATYSGAVL